MFQIRYKYVSEIDYEKLMSLKYKKFYKLRKQRLIFRFILFIVSLFFRFRARIYSVSMEKLKHPCFILMNHNSTIDFPILFLSMDTFNIAPITTVEAFCGNKFQNRLVTAIPKRRYVSEPNLLRDIKYCFDNLNQDVAIFPESKFSLIGSTEKIPLSIGKLIKHFKKPVIVVSSNGAHLRQPFWNRGLKRKVPVNAVATIALSEKDVKNYSVEEIVNITTEYLNYDDYEYQKAENISINEPYRALGLHSVLYKCPVCGCETTRSLKDKVFCTDCTATFKLNTNGSLSLINDPDYPIDSIKKWYKWIRKTLEDEIDDHYYFDEQVYIEVMIVQKGWYGMGHGKVVHNKNGWKLFDSEENLLLHNTVAANMSLHIEFDFANKGDCIVLSNARYSYYCFFDNSKISVTKCMLITEILYERQNLKS
ncbi:MAG: hypothetical protein LBV51_04770 [Acholeplasmatales bacterium]|jgi:1-acyl-sn-glycerol-3-phosphate acyltransferase|nr:hypothetical protein [Acholeplasmatales bacterium]